MVRSIYSSKVAQHKNPVPNAALHRGILVTSAIFGKDPETGHYPASAAQQIAMAFSQLEAVLEEAGTAPQDVVKLDLYFTNKGDRELANEHWRRIWPDAAHRPARHAHEAILPEGCAFQIVAMAVSDPAP
ncbi:MAG: RidA family protein [Bacteroidetes bacterium]|nr:RidA family protein [Bacteroidota bacterium]